MGRTGYGDETGLGKLLIGTSVQLFDDGIRKEFMGSRRNVEQQAGPNASRLRFRHVFRQCSS